MKLEKKLRQKVRGMGCLAVLGLPFLGVGLAVTGAFLWSFILHVRSGSWQRVDARIEHAVLKSHRGSKGGVTYSVEARYTYALDGGSFAGTRVGTDVGSSSGDHHRERYELLKRHQESGALFPALVNPADPRESLLFRDLPSENWVLLPFGLVFAGVGAGMIGFGIVSWRRSRRRAANLARDPGRPWRADGRFPHEGFIVDSRAARALWGWWIVGVLVGAFASVCVVLAFTQGAPVLAKCIVGLFATVALWLLICAAYKTAQVMKYGSPRLALGELPVVPGRRLVGIVTCQRHVQAEGAFRVTLKCVRTTGSGKSRHVETLYDRTTEVSEDLAPDRAGTGVPLDLAVPGDLPPTSAPDETPDVAWTLSVKAATPGVNFGAEFALPVFRVVDEALIEKRPVGMG